VSGLVLWVFSQITTKNVRNCLKKHSRGELLGYPGATLTPIHDPGVFSQITTQILRNGIKKHSRSELLGDPGANVTPIHDQGAVFVENGSPRKSEGSPKGAPMTSQNHTISTKHAKKHSPESAPGKVDEPGPTWDLPKLKIYVFARE